MKKLFFIGGTLLGAITTFYSLPYIEKENGSLKRPGLQHIQSYSIDEPYVSDEKKKQLFIYLQKTLKTLPSSMPDNEEVAEITRDIVRTIAKNDSEMKHFIDGYFTSHDSFTNRDFKAIISRYAKKEGL